MSIDRLSRLAAGLCPLLLAGCMTATADVPAAPYRALGTEPFWSVTIDGGQMTYDSAEGTRFTLPAPAPRTTFNGHRFETQRLTVDVTHAQCSDGMSDRIYADTVLVTADGRELKGCGEIVPPASLAGTSWTIMAIDGSGVDGSGVSGNAYFLRFTDDGISGKAGCNTFSGTYQRSGETLTAGALAVTRMACPSPLMQHESKVLAILAGPVEVEHGAGETLVLRGAAGSITLRRAI